MAPPRELTDFLGAIESFRAEGPALSFISASLDDRMAGDGDGRLDQGEADLTVRLRNTGFEDLSGTVVHAAAVGGHSDVTDSDEVLSSAPGEDITVELPVTLREASHHELVQFDLTFADPAAAIARTTVHARFHVHYDVEHTERADSVDDPITQADWFIRPGPSLPETVWARGEGEAIPPTMLLGTRMDRGVRGRRPASWPRPPRISSFVSSRPTGSSPYSLVDVGRPVRTSTTWQPVYFLPVGSSDGEEPVTVDLGRQFAGQWLQVRFLGTCPPPPTSASPAGP